MATLADVNYSMQRLVNAGLTRVGAAALVSRWVNVESNLSTSAVNPSSGAVGIAQWLGSRKQSGMSSWSLSKQIDYAIGELNGPESRAGNILRSTNDPYQAAIGASMYERAEGYNKATGVDNFTKKTQSGIGGILNMFSGGLAPNSSGSPDERDEKKSALAADDALGALSDLSKIGGAGSSGGSSGFDFSQWFVRGIIVILGFIFVAVGLALFAPKTIVAQAVNSAVK